MAETPEYGTIDLNDLSPKLNDDESRANACVLEIDQAVIALLALRIGHAHNASSNVQISTAVVDDFRFAAARLGVAESAMAGLASQLLFISDLARQSSDH